LSTEFLKGKKLAIKTIQKQIDKSSARSENGSDYSLSKWDQDQLTKVNALTTYPKHSEELRNVNIVAKAKLLKTHLQEIYPDRIWSVRSDTYSIDAEYTGKPISEDLDKIARLYSNSGKTDLQSDYFDYDNYCHIKESYKQHSERAKSFPECDFCQMKQEQMAVTSDDKNACTICRNNGNAGNSFKSIPEGMVN